MARRFAALEDCSVLILDLLDVPGVDGSAGLELEQLIRRAHAAGIEVITVGLRDEVAKVLTQTGSLDQVAADRRFATRREGVIAAGELIAARRQREE
jgi:anti-anti-sigma regulatory factor